MTSAWRASALLLVSAGALLFADALQRPFTAIAADPQTAHRRA
jgi:hypothetical protein